MKEDICRKIKGAAGVKLDSECIIPVSGKWALLARQLRYCDGRGDLKKEAQSCLRVYMKVNGGSVEQIDQLHPVEIANKLLAASGIRALEERYFKP